MASAVRAVLWDADGVLQTTPPDAWDLAVRVVEQFPGGMTGAPIDEARIRVVADDLGLGHRVDELLSVWSNFHVADASLAVVAQVRAAGTPCYLATNQDAFRAVRMRELAPYGDVLDGGYYSCDVGIAKPSPGFFEHIVADLGLAPDELLFLDDQPRNVAGARSVGLQAECWTHDDGVTRLSAILRDHGVPLA